MKKILSPKGGRLSCLNTTSELTCSRLSLDSGPGGTQTRDLWVTIVRDLTTTPTSYIKKVLKNYLKHRTKGDVTAWKPKNSLYTTDPGAAEGISDPLWRGEHNDVDDKKADGEESPAQTEAVDTTSVDLDRLVWCCHVLLAPPDPASHADTHS